MAGPDSDNYGPALRAIGEAKAKLQAGDTNVFKNLSEAEDQIVQAQRWTRRFLGQPDGAANQSQPIRSETNTTSRRLASVADPRVPPKHSMTKSVTFTLKSDRLARIGEEQFVLPAKSILVGQLSLEPSDGPIGIREYDNPSFLRACFDFEFGGRKMRYSGFVRECGLWAPNGTQTTFENSEFISECGVIDGMMDDREDWFYIRPDGGRHTNRLKYTSCHFELMLKTATVLVKCRYYDQNPNIAGYVTIYYSRDLDELLLRKDNKYSYDQNGNIEDWYPEEGPYVTLVEPGAAPNGGLAKPSGNSGAAEGPHR